MIKLPKTQEDPQVVFALRQLTYDAHFKEVRQKVIEPLKRHIAQTGLTCDGDSSEYKGAYQVLSHLLKEFDDAEETMKRIQNSKDMQSSINVG